MRHTTIVALFCAAFLMSACASKPVEPPPGETYFQVTPAVAATSGVTILLGIGLLAIVACGIACAP